MKATWRSLTIVTGMILTYIALALIDYEYIHIIYRLTGWNFP